MIFYDDEELEGKPDFNLTKFQFPHCKFVGEMVYSKLVYGYKCLNSRHGTLVF